MTSDHRCLHQFHGGHRERPHQNWCHHRGRCRGPALVAALALWAAMACVTVPAASASPATGDMSLLTMQRIKSYVDDTCTMDPHCQWTWDPLPNGLRNVSAEEAAAEMPKDYLYPPGEDPDNLGGQRDSLFFKKSMVVTVSVDMLWPRDSEKCFGKCCVSSEFSVCTTFRHYVFDQDKGDT
ncbi:hypothetical protein AGLY_006739 [Aphis glycines]|uniref:Uncharacterized protein n=1 Tax=Aphis glycines TaxID=307491 RepID=A0A6G0TQL2_APHGL|nr:hypothetical protein AGLY_006739 [Aphis glycines]